MPHSRPFLPCIFLWMQWNSNYTIFFLAIRGLKQGQYQPKSNHFWRCWEYISMPCFGPFLPCVLLRMTRNPNFTKLFGHQRAETGQILPKSNHYQSGTKPNLVAKIWPPNFVTICAWLPKLVANVSSNFHHLVNTGLAVGSFFKWLPITVAHTCK